MNGIRQNVRGPTARLAIMTIVLLLLLAGTAMAASVMHNQPVSAILLPVACFAVPVFYVVRFGLWHRSAPWAAQRSWAKSLSDKLSWDDRNSPTSVTTRVRANWARPRVYYPVEKFRKQSSALCLNTA